MHDMAAHIQSDDKICIGESMDGVRNTDHSYTHLLEETRLGKKIP